MLSLTQTRVLAFAQKSLASGAGSIGPIFMGNCIFVDAVNGNDATALRGRQDKPFLTIQQALNNSTPADTIIVLPGTYSEAITRVGGSLSNSIVLIDAVVQSPAALPTFYGTFLALSVFGIGRSKVLGGTGRAFSLDLTELTLNNLYVKSPDTAVYARGTFDIQNCTVVSTNAAIAPVAVNLYDLGLEIEQSRLVSSTIFNASATLEAVEFLGALPADKIYIDGNASNLPWMPNAAAIYGNNVTDINIIA